MLMPRGSATLTTLSLCASALTLALVLAIAGAQSFGYVCPTVPQLSPWPATLPASAQADLQRLQYAIEAAFDSSGATGGIATLVYDQQQVLTIPWGTTRTGGAGNNITGDTVFRLGSNSKVFTAMMMFQLRDAGKLSLDQQVSDVVPSYQPKPHPGFSSSRSATFSDLASHQAGLPREPTCDVSNCTQSLAEMIAIANTYTLIYPPGAQVSYSNMGFGLLGRFMEGPASSTWEDWVAGQILKPLGMTNSGNAPPSDLSNMAFGYMDGVQQALTPLGAASPAGNMYSSANDMAKWISLYFRDGAPYNPAAGQILDGASIRESLTRRAHTNPTPVKMDTAFPTEWGFPWEVLTARLSDPAMSRFSEFNVLGKDGVIGGYQSLMSMVPELKTGLFITISTGSSALLGNFLGAAYNITPLFAVPFVYKLMAQLNADPFPPLPDNAGDYVGSFYIPSFPGKYNATVSLTADVLVLNGATMYVNQPLGPLGNDLWQMLGWGPNMPCYATQLAATDYILQFVRGPSGSVTGFSIQGFGLPPPTLWVKV